MPVYPDLPTADFKLHVHPMAHVGDLGENITFYEALGGNLVFGSRDGGRPHVTTLDFDLPDVNVATYSQYEA